MITLRLVFLLALALLVAVVYAQDEGEVVASRDFGEVSRTR